MTSLALDFGLDHLALLGPLAQVLSPALPSAYAIWGVSFSFLSGVSSASVDNGLQAGGEAAAFARMPGHSTMGSQAAGDLAKAPGLGRGRHAIS